MTADEIFDSVIALCFSENADKEMYTSFKGMLNIVLAETFNLNNSWREKEGKDALSEIPYIKELTDKVPYESMLLRLVIPYGVAGMLYAEDDDNGMGSYYRTKYETAMIDFAQANFEEVIEII